MIKMQDVYMIWMETDTHQEYETLIKLIKKHEHSIIGRSMINDAKAPHIVFIDEFKDEGCSLEVNDAGRKLLQSWCDELNKGGEVHD